MQIASEGIASSVIFARQMKIAPSSRAMHQKSRLWRKPEHEKRTNFKKNTFFYFFVQSRLLIQKLSLPLQNISVLLTV